MVAAGSNKKTEWQGGFAGHRAGREGLEEGKTVSPLVPLLQMFYFYNYFSYSFIISFPSPLVVKKFIFFLCIANTLETLVDNFQVLEIFSCLDLAFLKLSQHCVWQCTYSLHGDFRHGTVRNNKIPDTIVDY